MSDDRRANLIRFYAILDALEEALDPTMDRGPVGQIFGKRLLQELLFSRNYHRRDKDDRGNKRDEQPEIIQPDGQSNHEHDER